MKYLRREVWGYSIYQKEKDLADKQIGAGVGLPLEFHLRRGLTKAETRLWGKRGVLLLGS